LSDAVIIMGPTAVGKSEVALLVAEALGGEIVSADSMQIYRGLDRGTAKPTAAARARVPHHMIDVADPAEGYSVWQYRRAAGEVIADLLRRKKLPVIVGGTGLYIHSLLCDMDFGGAKGDERARAKYEQLAKERGAAYVHDLLKEQDPKAAAKIHPNNLKRVIRALERVENAVPVIARSEATKRSIEMPASADHDEADGPEEATREYKAFSFDLRRSDLMDPALFLLTRERADLVRRIDARVDAMLRAGLVRETEELARRGLTLRQSAMLGIGYKETLGYLNGDYSREEAIELIKIHTRRYAKRQMTWMRRYKDAQVIDLTARGEEKGAAEIQAHFT
jgi:tRNA dimethylallyltransferase